MAGNEYWWGVPSSVFQVTTPNFPVVVKLGHAHAGMGKVRKRKNTYTSGKRYLCGTASLRSYPVCGQMVKGLDVPPAYLCGSGCCWARRGLLLLPCTRSQAAMWACKLQGCRRGGVKSGGKAGWAEVIRLVFYTFSSLPKVVMLFIQAPAMHSYTPQFSQWGTAALVLLCAWWWTYSTKWEPFSFFFFSSLLGRTRLYKAEWLVACQGILKNSSLPRRTCLFFPGSLGSLFPQWITSPCFWGCLGSLFSEASPACPCCAFASFPCIYLFKKNTLYLSKTWFVQN